MTEPKTYSNPPILVYPSIDKIPANLWQWAPYFFPQEVACRCCGTIKIAKHALDGLLATRREYGEPFILNCGYRCPKHNEAVGGTKRSQHLEGTAFDIRLTTRVEREKLIEIARRHGAMGIGRYHSFQHLDWRETPAEWDTR